MKKIFLSLLCCMLAVVGLQAQSYVKVTSAPADWTGDYLIVYEGGNVAFNGGLSTLDAVSNTISVSISNGEIASDVTTDAAKFTIEAVSDGYAIKSVSGYYIGVSSNSNGLKTATTATTYKHTLSIDESGNADIKSIFDGSNMTMRYNKASGQYRFRYYKSGQEAIQLYKYTAGEEGGEGGGEEDTTPVLTADVDALTFKNSPGATTEAQTVKLSVKNLDAVSYTCSNAAFDVVDNGDYTYDVTFTAPDEEGTTDGTLTFTAEGVDDVVVSLTGVSANSITDVLNREFTTVSGTSYKDWTGTGASGAVYKGQSAGGNDAIQLRSSSSNSGIVTTTSGGKVVSVTVTWQTSTSSARVLNVYGKNTAYTAATDLYATDTQGTLLGTIQMGTSTLEIDGDYEYIGLRSKSGAMYLSEIQIEWATVTANPTEVEAPTFNPVAGEVYAGTEVSISTNSGSTLKYTVNGGDAITTDGNTATVTINEETTIEALAIAADGVTTSETVSATYTIKQKPAYDNIAAFVDAAPAEEAILSGTVTVTYQNSNNLFVTDTTGSLLIYGVSGTYTNGQTLTGVTGTYTLYNGLPEITNATLPEAVAGDAVEPAVMTVDEVKNLEAKDYSRYIKLEGVEVTESTIGDITLYNKFGIELTTGTNCTVVGIVSYYNDLQIYPIEITAIEDETKLDVPTFNPAPGAVVAGTEVTISTIEGAKLVYTINDGDMLESAENIARVTIDVDTEIVVYATMEGYTDSEVVTVKYTVIVPAAAGEYELVTDASTLQAGDKIVIVAAEYDYALSTTQNNNNRGQAEVTKNENNTVTFGDDVQVIYLQEGSVEGTFGFYVPGTIDGEKTVAGYLYAASTSGNQLKTRDNLEDDGKADWTITIADGVTSIVAQGTDEGLNDDLKYNNTSSLFSCYATGSSQKDVVIYRMVRYEENIVSEKNYYLDVNDMWETADSWFAAYFENKNTDSYAWVRGELVNNSYLFYLSQYNVPTAAPARAKAEESEAPVYTHVTFVRMSNDATEMSFDGALNQTTGITYDGGETAIFSLTDSDGNGEWISLPTAIDAVEATNGIVYANNVVVADGAIVVYNMSGAVVAYGENTLDLRGLNAGVYVVRNGNNAVKVVR